MATRRSKTPLTVTVEQPATLRHSARLAGPVRAVHPVLKALGVPWQYDNRRHAYLVPRSRVDDVAAAIELAGHHVEITLPGWS